MRITLILAALLALAQPAIAADCYTPEQLVTDVAKAGDTELATLHWTGSLADTVVVVEGGGVVIAWAFKGGCEVATAILDTVTTKNKGTPA